MFILILLYLLIFTAGICFYYYDKISDQSYLQKKGLTLADSSRSQFIMVGRECQQHKVAGGFGNTVRMQREVNCATLIFSV